MTFSVDILPAAELLPASGFPLHIRQFLLPRMKTHRHTNQQVPWEEGVRYVGHRVQHQESDPLKNSVCGLPSPLGAEHLPCELPKQALCFQDPGRVFCALATVLGSRHSMSAVLFIISFGQFPLSGCRHQGHGKESRLRLWGSVWGLESTFTGNHGSAQI